MHRFFWVLGLILGISVGQAMELKDVPNPRVERGSYVQDSADLLNAEQSARLDALSVELEAKTGAELAFVTIDNLGQLSVEEFASHLFKRYGIGKKTKNNGILVLVALEDRRFRVEVGYGLEAVLPDALCKRLMDQLAVPRFKAGDFGDGLYELGVALAQKVAGSEGMALNLEAVTPREDRGEAGQESQVVGFVGATAEPPSWGPPWWIWFNGPLILVFTLAFIVWRSLRFYFSPSFAGKMLALDREPSTYPLQLFALGGGASFFLIALVGSLHTLLSFLGGGGVAVGLWLAWRKFHLEKALSYRRNCGRCGRPMERIQEIADDAFLKESEIDEEKAEGVDYEFWHCAPCIFQERFDVKLPYASNCPKCRNRSLKTKETIISEATYSTSGKKRIDKNCYYRACRHAETIYKTLPKKTRSSSSSGGGGRSGGGGSFGGGSSGGGGASGGW